MGIIYRGNCFALKSLMLRKQEQLNQRYKELLGEENYKRLEAANEQTLTPESFYSDRHRYRREVGSSPLGQDFYFGAYYLSGFALDENGAAKEASVKSAPVFFTLPQPADDQELLAKYVRLFNKYVLYALQEPPVDLVIIAAQSNVPFTPSSDVSQMNASLEKLGRQPIEKLAQYIDLAVTFLSYQELYAAATEILDNLVLQPFNIAKPLLWRNKPREYTTFALTSALMPTEIQFTMPSEGDAFYGMDDMQAVADFLNWHKNGFNAGEYVQNLLRSVKAMKVERLPISELLRAA